MTEPTVTLHNGDSLAVLPTLADCSVDALVTDPPAGIAFMGAKWDSFPVRDRTKEQGAARQAKKFRKGLGNGFDGVDYSVNARSVFVAFLSATMAECLRVLKPGAYGLVWAIPRTSHWTALALEDAGFEIRDRISHLFGTGFPKAKSCLKPACEDWWLVRKPGRGVKPLNIDDCRVATLEDCRRTPSANTSSIYAQDDYTRNMMRGGRGHDAGRWPANVVLDEDAAAMLDEQSGTLTSNSGIPFKRNAGKQYEGGYVGGQDAPAFYGDSGGASRFFYVSKASRTDRGAGNTHPTVKSTDLMRWLCRLITPPGGTVLDCFMGSGSTGKAALAEGFNFIGIEREAEYFAIAQARINAALKARSEQLIPA